MRLTESQLRKIIREEKQKLLREFAPMMNRFADFTDEELREEIIAQTVDLMKKGKGTGWKYADSDWGHRLVIRWSDFDLPKDQMAEVSKNHRLIRSVIEELDEMMPNRAIEREYSSNKDFISYTTSKPDQYQYDNNPYEGL